MKSGPVIKEVDSLGRNVNLGQNLCKLSRITLYTIQLDLTGNIYYGTTDRIDPSANLWSIETIKKFSVSTPYESSDTRFEVTQSTLDRTDLIDLDADLGLSFMGGLVSAKGSAKYLDNRRSKKNEGKNPHRKSIRER